MQIGNCRWFRAPATILGPGSGFASSARNSSCRPSSLNSSSLSVLADTPSAIAPTIFFRRASRTAVACSTAEFWPAGPGRPNAFSGFIKLVGSRSAASKTAAQAEIKTPSPGFCEEGRPPGGMGGRRTRESRTYRPSFGSVCVLPAKGSAAPAFASRMPGARTGQAFQARARRGSRPQPVPLHQPCRQRPLRA